MKRSNVLWKLTQSYNSIPAEANIYQVCDHLLSAMERMGMLPPERKVTVPVTSKDGIDDTEDVTFFSWEPEDPPTKNADGPTESDLDGINFNMNCWV